MPAWYNFDILFTGGMWSSEVRVVLLDVKNGVNIDWGCTQREMPKFPGIREPLFKTVRY